MAKAVSQMVVIAMHMPFTTAKSKATAVAMTLANAAIVDTNISTTMSPYDNHCRAHGGGIGVGCGRCRFKLLS